MTECPVCGGEVPLEDDVVEAELIECPDCGTELEVVSVNPAKLAEAPQTEEDWGQ
jgi:alpha-aminoadipate carrier protein LysW